MKYVIFILFIFNVSCNSKDTKKNIVVNNSGNSLRSRIPPPFDYYWAEEDSNSFGAFLQNIALEQDGAKILNYFGIPIDNQSEHVAVLSYDVGNKDLQQCADAIIRIRAEYLFETGRFDEIGFHFTSGDLYTWNDFKDGYRPVVVNGNSVKFKKTANKDDSKSAFRKYLDMVYMYAGTISLNSETKPLSPSNAIESGDIIINPGSPGHAVLIAGRAINSNNQVVYLIIEGYTPAQSIHVLTNPFENDINPWYRISVSDGAILTARYEFTKSNIRRF